MALVCPRCGSDDLRVHVLVACTWDGVGDEIPEEDLQDRIASDGIISPSSYVACNNEDCEWAGKVRELHPIAE